MSNTPYPKRPKHLLHDAAVIVRDEDGVTYGYSPTPDDLLMVWFEAGFEPDRRVLRHGHHELVEIVSSPASTPALDCMTWEVAHRSTGSVTSFERCSQNPNGPLLLDLHVATPLSEAPYLLATPEFGSADGIHLLAPGDVLAELAELLSTASVDFETGPSLSRFGPGGLRVPRAGRWPWVYHELRSQGWWVDDLTAEPARRHYRAPVMNLDRHRRKRPSGPDRQHESHHSPRVGLSKLGPDDCF